MHIACNSPPIIITSELNMKLLFLNKIPPNHQIVAKVQQLTCLCKIVNLKLNFTRNYFSNYYNKSI